MASPNQIPLMERDESGSGDPLVLMPGGLTGWVSWIPHAEVLSESRRVIRLQLHSVALGLTGDPLPPDYSIGYEVNSLAKTLDELNLAGVDIAAWSYGGAVSLSYAIHNPERVKSLTLIEPPAYWVLRSQGPLSEKALDEQQFLKTLAVDEISAAQLIEFLNFSGIASKGVDARSLPPWDGWYKHRNSLRFGDAPFVYEDDIELVRAFEKPVLMIKGEGSPKYYHDVIDVLGEEFPNAQVVMYPGGHAAHIASMEQFMDRFTRFLSERI